MTAGCVRTHTVEFLYRSLREHRTYILTLLMHCLACALATEPLMTDSFVHLIKLGMEYAGWAVAQRSVDSLVSIS